MSTDLLEMLAVAGVALVATVVAGFIVWKLEERAIYRSLWEVADLS